MVLFCFSGWLMTERDGEMIGWSKGWGGNVNLAGIIFDKLILHAQSRPITPVELVYGICKTRAYTYFINLRV